MSKHNETLDALKRMSEEDPNGFSSDILALIDFKCKTTKTEAIKEFAEKLIEERLAVVLLKEKTDEYAEGYYDALCYTEEQVVNLKNEIVDDV